MERTSGPQGIEIFIHKHIWRCVFLASLCVFLLVPLLMAGVTPVQAAPLTPSKNIFTVSPTQGPVGTVVVITGNSVFFSDGTRVNLGYSADGQTCTIVAGGQAGVVQNGSFRGWFRWPAGTGTGTFDVCAVENAFTFKLGSYQVLSVSAPHVSVLPTTLKAGKQATAYGAHFLPGGTSVKVAWRSTSGGQTTVLGTAVSNSSGAFALVFTAPVHSSTGSYTLTATVGSGSPPTMSAFATLHVDGITLVGVGTPGASVSPSAEATVPAGATATPQAVSHPPMLTRTVVPDRSGLFVAVAASGAFLIVLALGAGVLVVRRQRRARAGDPTSGPLFWPEAAAIIAGGVPGGAAGGRDGGPISGSGIFTPWPGAMYPGGNSPAGNPGMEYLPLPEATAPQSAINKAAMLPFDPGLAEAMREAQVSLFATPRPPVHEEMEIR